jgi:hypothetical protein
MGDGSDDKIVRLSQMQREAPTWIHDAVFGETGKLLAVLASAVAALKAEMPDYFALDEMLGAPVLMHPLEDQEVDKFLIRPMTDADVSAVQIRLQHAGLKRLSKDVAHHYEPAHIVTSPVERVLERLGLRSRVNNVIGCAVKDQQPGAVAIDRRVAHWRGVEIDAPVLHRRRAEVFLRDLVTWADDLIVLPLRQHFVDVRRIRSPP